MMDNLPTFINLKKSALLGGRNGDIAALKLSSLCCAQARVAVVLSGGESPFRHDY